MAEFDDCDLYVNGPRYLVRLEEEPNESLIFCWAEVIAAGVFRSEDGGNDSLYFAVGDRVFVDTTSAVFVEIRGVTLAVIDEQDAYISMEEFTDEGEEAASKGD